MAFIIHTRLDELLKHGEHLTDKLNEHGKGWQGLLNTIGIQLESSTRERFATARAPDGTAWQGLMRRTLQGRISKTTGKITGGGILVQTGQLQSSFMYHVQGNTLTIGTHTEYAHHHQAGTRYIPARPFLGISDEDSDTIADILTRYLND